MDDLGHPIFAYARREAQSVLRMIDQRFSPRIYFVKVLRADDNSVTLDVGPHDAPFRPVHFDGILIRADEFEKKDPEYGVSPWMPSPEGGAVEEISQMNANKKRGIRGRSLRAAVTEAVAKLPSTQNHAYFCGFPAEFVDGQLLLILEVQKDIYDSYYRLKEGSYAKRVELLDYRRETSFIDGVIEQCLGVLTAILESEKPPRWHHEIRIGELTAVAARELMRTVARETGRPQTDQNELFSFCNQLSYLPYEGKEGVGTIVFCEPRNPNVTVTVPFVTPVPLTSAKAVRKLLQMASAELSLLCTSNEAIGLGRVEASYDPATESVFQVSFAKRGEWVLKHAGQLLMHVSNGTPSIAPEFHGWEFKQVLSRVFRGITEEEITRVCDAAELIAGQKHGCMLVVVGNAHAEVERLKSQATPVKPFRLTAMEAPHVTKIDGAVLVDFSGECHAIGVILDGKASNKCSPDRGSRYNSAVRYVYDEKMKPKAVAVVKSEDGMVNILPVLMPQIPKRSISTTLQDLRELAGQPEQNMGDLWEVMAWFDNHEFYLTQDECNEIEKIRDEVTDKTMKDPFSMHRYRRKLRPTTEMDESYFLPE